MDPAAAMENEKHVFHRCLDGAQNAPPTGSTRFGLSERGPRLRTYFTMAVEEFARAGFSTTGFDLDVDKVWAIRMSMWTVPAGSYDCVVVMSDHAAFDYDLLQRAGKVVVDTRNAIKNPGPNVLRLGGPRCSQALESLATA